MQNYVIFQFRIKIFLHKITSLYHPLLKSFFDRKNIELFHAIQYLQVLVTINAANKYFNTEKQGDFESRHSQVKWFCKSETVLSFHTIYHGSFYLFVDRSIIHSWEWSWKVQRPNTENAYKPRYYFTSPSIFLPKFHLSVSAVYLQLFCGWVTSSWVKW